MMVEAKMEKELCRGRQLRCSLGQMSRCLRGCWLRFSKTLDLKGRLGCSKEGWMRMTSLVRQLRQSLDFVGALVLNSLFKIYPMMLAEDKVFVHRDGSKGSWWPVWPGSQWHWRLSGVSWRQCLFGALVSEGQLPWSR